MFTRRHWGVVAAVFALVISSEAAAQQVDFGGNDQASIDIQNFQPSASPYSIFGVESATVSGHLVPSGGIVLHYAHEPLVLVTESGDEIAIIEQQLVGEAVAAIGLFDSAELGIAAPVYLINAGGVDNLSIDGATLGDIRLRGKYSILDSQKAPIGVGAYLQVGVPSGNDQAFTSSGTVSVRPGVIVDVRIDKLLLAGNLSTNLQEQQAFANLDVGSQFLFAFGAEYEVHERVSLGGELFGSSTFDDAFSKEEAPMEFLVGAKYKSKTGIQVHGGAGAGIVAGYGSPQFRTLLGLRYAQTDVDTDQDGILDRDDLCPDVKEDVDGFEDSDGCPDEDNDKDGYKDKEDSCPDQAEDFDEFDDADGCPDLDNDEDGFPDTVDKCPNKPGVEERQGCPNDDRDADGFSNADDLCPDEPEDKDNYQDEDGCPEPDNDLDGIMDDKDSCPLAAEDFDGWMDEDGCPEPDNDQDGVLDNDDKCPLEAGKPKFKGCPGKRKVVLLANEIKILDKVYFATGKAKIKRRSHGLLGEVADLLVKHPEIKKIEIQGHTDDQGNDRSNMKLSDARAKSVLDYLVAQGVEAERLTSRGFGESSPAVQIEGLNRRELKKARAANRRVEFRIVNMEMRTTVIEEAPE